VLELLEFEVELDAALVAELVDGPLRIFEIPKELLWEGPEVLDEPELMELLPEEPVEGPDAPELELLKLEGVAVAPRAGDRERDRDRERDLER